MKTRFQLIIVAAILLELVVLFSLGSYYSSRFDEKNAITQDSSIQTALHAKSRLLCQTTNGQTFYDGVAFAVNASSGVVTFTPGDGPQTGLIINTTFPCTWTTLK